MNESNLDAMKYSLSIGVALGVIISYVMLLDSYRLRSEVKRYYLLWTGIGVALDSYQEKILNGKAPPSNSFNRTTG